MSAAVDALVDNGDQWLRAANETTRDDPQTADYAEATYAATMAVAYFLRAQIVARDEASAKGRAAAEQFTARLAEQQRQQLGKGAT